MKAFWTIRAAVQTAGGTWRPDLPENLRYTVTGDLNRMTAGAAPADHVHLVSGGLAVASEQAGGGHEHYVIYHNGAWIQKVRGTATAHNHPFNETQDFFLVFVMCEDELLPILQAAPWNVRVICEAQVNAEGFPGALADVAWTTAERNVWATLALNQLGINLPVEVDRGVRLVSLLLGLSLSRRPKSDEGYR